MKSFLRDRYVNLLNDLKEKIRQAQVRAAVKVNYELLKIYWQIGKAILKQQKERGWGSKIIDNLAIDLKLEFPDFKGISLRNLKYMRAFAEAYPDFLKAENSRRQPFMDQVVEFVQPLNAQIPWTHHTIILDKVKATDERRFYIKKTLENNWSKNVLKLQIDSHLYQRQGKAITNFEHTLPQPQSDLARETLKNPYVLDFLGLTEQAQEHDLENALILHLKKFMLELGRGFAYVGNQKNLIVGGDDYFLDLLFFNYNLDCFVVFELKVGEFKPEYTGKLNFYVNAVNAQIKCAGHKPTIGILLCKTPNDTVVKYSLQGVDSPIGVSDYELGQALPNRLRAEIPTVEEFETEIEKEYRELKSPGR